MTRLHRLRLRLLLGCFVLPGACASPPPAAPPQDLTVRVRDFAIDAPDSIPAGLTAVHLLNAGPSTHHAQLYRLPDSLTPADAIALLPPTEPLPSLLVPVGGPEGADDPARPVTSIVPLTPGQYLILCRFETARGELHYTLGMVRALMVTGPPSGSLPSLPGAPDTILLQDYAFGGPDSLPAGPDTILVLNRGPHEHHLALARLLPDRTLQDAWREFTVDDAEGATDILGGTTGLAPGRANLFPIDLRPGSYVLLCLVPDPATGQEHVALGMIRALHVYDAAD
jgi:hypothetical protein